MYKNKLGWTVFGLFGALLLADFRKVPNHDAAIAATRGYQVTGLSTKFDLVDVVSVLAQTKELCLHVTHVPHGYASIHAARHHQILIKGREIDRHNFSDVSFDTLANLLVPPIPKFEFFVVTD